MLAVHFYSMNDKYCGEGYLMPDVATFEDYALNHMEATKIGDNKYKLPVRSEYDPKRYICLEEQNFRKK